jgi:hypothetical protein
MEIRRAMRFAAQRSRWAFWKPAHWAGLPGKEAVCFLIAPLTPVCQTEVRDAPPVNGLIDVKLLDAGVK